jgi:hypothetical protein
MSNWPNLDSCLYFLQHTLESQDEAHHNNGEVCKALRYIHVNLEYANLGIVRDLMISLFHARFSNEKCRSWALAVYVLTLEQYDDDDKESVEFISDLIHLHQQKFEPDVIQHCIKGLGVIAGRNGYLIAYSYPMTYLTELYRQGMLDRSCFPALLSLLMKCSEILQEDSIGMDLILSVALDLISESEGFVKLKALDSLKKISQSTWNNLSSDASWWYSQISSALEDNSCGQSAFLISQLLERMNTSEFAIGIGIENDLQVLLPLYLRICQSSSEFSRCVRLIGSQLSKFNPSDNSSIAVIQGAMVEMYNRLASNIKMLDKHEACQMLEECKLKDCIPKKFPIFPLTCKEKVSTYYRCQLEKSAKEKFNVDDILDLVVSYASDECYQGQQIDFLTYNAKFVSGPTGQYWQAAEVVHVDKSNISVRCIGARYGYIVNLASQSHRFAPAFTYTAVEPHNALSPAGFQWIGNQKALIASEACLDISPSELEDSIRRYHNSLPDTINGLRWRNRDKLMI